MTTRRSAIDSSRRVASTAAVRRIRSLWGRDRGGRFRTFGRHSQATVRGTRWLTVDRCDGTLTRVTSAAVAVRDRHPAQDRDRPRRALLSRAREALTALLRDLTARMEA